MTVTEFIQTNREMIDDHIRSEVGHIKMYPYVEMGIDDSERESWIMNDETLYLVAISEGVEV